MQCVGSPLLAFKLVLLFAQSGSPTALRATTFMEPIRNVDGDLALLHIGATCRPNARIWNGAVTTLDRVHKLCDENPHCDFYGWNAATLTAELCRGDDAGLYKSAETLMSIVGIKHRMFEVPGFTTLTNQQAVCELPNIVAEIHGCFRIDEAARKCSATTGCTYFTMSSVAGLDGMMNKWANTLWLCTGPPEFAYHAGWLAAARTDNLDVGLLPVLPGINQ